MPRTLKSGLTHNTSWLTSKAFCLQESIVCLSSVCMQTRHCHEIKRTKGVDERKANRNPIAIRSHLFKNQESINLWTNSFTEIMA